MKECGERGGGLGWEEDKLFTPSYEKLLEDGNYLDRWL